ncbi:hypothetical protein [Halarcobacter bivalviorum]|uniref:Uncharacterized protein n=1 Tax=Halarcobacter bivalviorum TaxID=663364 RepID=A0AAX2A4T1_9BACT|nr:hypothetical protein [Halarcobacter bivalviorum]AXH11646.1 hypothetical protein ABIV_0633 [Halarcobacter bivalviorum]RXK08859.1 hypothetical protein CRV05_13085 [Halarcobacter bivalviorum]
MKKSFILFSVIILLFVFSLLMIKIYETKSINSLNIVNQYKYIQAKNHLLFLEEYLRSLNDFSSLSKLEIEDKDYKIIAFISSKESLYEIELIVKAFEHNVRVHKSFTVSK